MDIECKKHGLTRHRKRPDRKGWLCVQCRTECMRRLRAKRKQKWIDKAGGKCNKCNYNKCTGALHFHHLRDKKFTLDKNTLLNKSELELQHEFEKCILLCANCHAEIHYDTE